MVAGFCEEFAVPSNLLKKKEKETINSLVLTVKINISADYHKKYILEN